VNLKAILVCDDIRIEAAGTLTIVGAFNERMIVEPGTGPIFVPRLSCLAVVAGLKGIHQIGYRQRIVALDGPPEEAVPPLEAEPHDALANEHNFIFQQAPMTFPGPGAYEMVLDLDTGARQATFRYRFYLERAPAAPDA